MEAVFLKILNMSISASWLALAVLLLRLVFKKAPKALTVFLWALVGIRLLLPVSIESIFSLVPSVQTIPPEITTAQTPAIHAGISVLNQAVNPIIAQSFSPDPATSANPLQILMAVGWNIWLLGMVCMLLYSAVSYIRLRWQVRVCLHTQGNIYLCDQVTNPFILGIFRPRIYLPSGMEEAQQQYVLAHENAHLKRKDHWWKPLGFLLLSIHWFNPVLWVAYILMCRDIEFACDEKVIKDMDSRDKKGYSEALVACSMQRRAIMACPLAFGEVGVKARIKSVLNYKKPAFWIILIALVLSIVLAVGFLTDPVSHKTIDAPLRQFLEDQICEHYGNDFSSNVFCLADLEVLDTKTQGDEITIYMWAIYGVFPVDFVFMHEIRHSGPTVITVKQEQDGYTLLEYWTPRDDEYRQWDIKTKFPLHLHRDVLDNDQLHKTLFDRIFARAAKQLAWGGFNTGVYTYTYLDSGDVLPPTLTLNNYDKTFSFMFSGYSSYFPRGSFTIQNDRLIAKTDDGMYTYVFSRHPDGWAFAEGPSSPIPQYRYPEGLQSPVPDGALFTATPIAPATLPELPTLTISYEQQQISAWTGTYSWKYSNPDGSLHGIEADSPHPLTCLDSVPKLSLIPTAASADNPYRAVLTFSQTPTQVSINRYPLYTVPSEGAQTLNYTGGPLDMLFGTYLYEICATFDSGDTEGTVHYAFTTGKPIFGTITQGEPYGLSIKASWKQNDLLVVTFTQALDHTEALGVGQSFTLEAKHNDQWLPLETYMRSVLGYDYSDPEIVFDLLLYQITPGTPIEMTHDLSRFQLPAGTYRICKDVTVTLVDGKAAVYPYYAEFTVPQ